MSFPKLVRGALLCWMLVGICTYSNASGSASHTLTTHTDPEDTPNSLTTLMVEVVKEELENVLEEVQVFLDMPPLEPSEVFDVEGKTIRGYIKTLTFSVEGLRRELPQLFQLPASEVQSFTADLSALFQKIKNVVSSYKLSRYCESNRGTPLSSKTMEEWIPPQVLTQHLRRIQKQLPAGTKLAFPVDFVSTHFYYNLPDVKATCLGLDTRNNMNWHGTLSVPTMSASGEWGSHSVTVSKNSANKATMRMRILAFHTATNRAWLLSAEESAQCMALNSCNKIPTRKSALLSKDATRCVIEKKKEDVSRCLALFQSNMLLVEIV